MTRCRLIVPLLTAFAVLLPALATAEPPRAGPVRSVPDGAGGMYFAWSDSRDGNADVYLLRLDSAGQPVTGWPADGRLVCGATGDQRLLAVVADGANGVVLAWLDERAEAQSGDVWAQRVTSAGTPLWATDGVLVAHAMWNWGYPEFAPDGTGGLICGWSHGGGGDADALAARVDASGSTPSGWTVNGLVVSDTTGFQDVTGVVGDGAGGAFVVWGDSRAGAGGVYGQHVGAAGNALWLRQGARLDGGVESGDAAAIPDGSGGLVVTYLVNGGVRAQRFSSAGAPLWIAGGKVVLADPNAYAVSLEPAPSNGTLLTWTRQDGIDNQVLAQKLDASGARSWDTTGVVVAHAGSATMFGDHAVPDGQGGSIVRWLDRRNAADQSFTLWTQRLDAGGTPLWTANGVPVSAAPTSPDLPEAVAAGTGGALFAWQDYSSSGTTVRVQRYDGAGVPQQPVNGRVLVSDLASQYVAGVVPDGSGGTWVVWDQSVAGGNALFARRLGSAGTPAGARITVCDDLGTKYFQSVTSDGAGGLLAAWLDLRDLDAGGGLHAQHLTSAGATPWGANGVPVTPSGTGAYQGSIVPDGAGGAYVAWDQYGLDVRVQHFAANGTAQWSAQTTAICDDAGIEDGIVALPDGAGGVLVAWFDDRVPGDAGVYAQRLDGAGAPLWTAGGVRISSHGSDPYYPFGVSSDGSGGAIVLVGGYAGATPQRVPPSARRLRHARALGFSSGVVLRAQRVTAAGAASWGPAGAFVVGPTGTLEGARIAADGAGGAVIGWDEDRTGRSDVYAQRLDASGVAQWLASGLVVCDAAGVQTLTGLATAAPSGVVLGWSDERAGAPDIYAQRLALDGPAAWGANGTAVVNAARGQFLGGIASDGAGGAFVAWSDNASGSVRNAAAQHLAANGTGTWGSGGVTSALASLAAASLDARGAHVEWIVAGDGPVTVERAGAPADWQALRELLPDGGHRVRLDDAGLGPELRRGYRLSRRGPDGVVTAGEVWLEPATPGLALSAPTPNPARPPFAIGFTLDDPHSARLEVFDLAGRRLESHRLDGFGPGRHVLRVGDAIRSAGVHFVRLEQGGRSEQVRVVTLH